MGLSYGVAVNGAIVGAIAAVFPGMYAPRRHLSFSSTRPDPARTRTDRASPTRYLLIELYAILVFLGAAAFMTLPEPPEALGPLLDFYKDW